MHAADGDCREISRLINSGFPTTKHQIPGAAMLRVWSGVPIGGASAQSCSTYADRSREFITRPRPAREEDEYLSITCSARTLASSTSAGEQLSKAEQSRSA